jgi:hypothetical protein
MPCYEAGQPSLILARFKPFIGKEIHFEHPLSRIWELLVAPQRFTCIKKQGCSWAGE